MSTVRVQRVLPVEPEVVFRRFTGEIGQWWSPRTAPWGTGAAVLRLGEGEGAAVHEGDRVVGRIEVWSPPREVAFSLHGSRVRVAFDAHARGTLLVLEHTGWQAWAGPVDRQSFHDVVAGFWLGQIPRV